MSRKDYVAIADAIAEVRKLDGITAGAALLEVQHRLAELFSAENPRFNEARFHSACLGL